MRGSEQNHQAANPLTDAYVALRADLVRFLTARLGNHAAAEDVYQELFVRIRTAQADVIENPPAFLFRSAYNLANEFARAGHRRVRRDDAWTDLTNQKVGINFISDGPDADDAIDAKRRLDQLLDGLNELTPKCRMVFTQHHLQGLSHRQIADGLGVSIKAVEKQMTTALKYLAAKLGVERSRSGKT